MNHDKQQISNPKTHLIFLFISQEKTLSLLKVDLSSRNFKAHRPEKTINYVLMLITSFFFVKKQIDGFCIFIRCCKTSNYKLSKVLEGLVYVLLEDLIFLKTFWWIYLTRGVNIYFKQSSREVFITNNKTFQVARN